MNTTGGESPDESQQAAAEPPESATVAVHESSPDRVVFVEEGNSDAWIATDTTVDPTR